MTAPTTISKDTAKPPVSDAAVAEKKPLGSGAAAVFAVLLAAAVVAAGVIAGRDALIAAGALTGDRWIDAGLLWLDGLTAQNWMAPAGIGVAVLGVVLLVAAVAPRRRPYVATSIPGVWLRRRDLPALAHAAVVDMAAVTSTRVRATRRKVSVALTAHPGTDCAALQKQAKTAVDDALSSLTKPPKVTVSASTGRTRS
ncbi:hypothetical protein HQ346_10200 [Rhodococcus sp. BP-252]|uniref:DUF6286 domain-containing protein n=1 Tax=unclassified Rhodococcus (in: high G+C Gram-positive bacteria) TaxID=192944 RepID=UPI001C9ABC89|nr:MULTISPECIES: DUF6286 domain-containing protein [unclassified Rhodococcus (in: high G+C Gram-positive bacteria)]MBY6412343.1 hypothetical protein [Rhodococcus sp. BP-320]MBY6416923.1 hypothetical protein [Rhodococcus sp. BP-321]MBY6421539.1 hypothetical protein [Rhodococcus sp. BP-324]MBY6426805.1 hypothetical protein [Rhodococcus sp. BP-323]MBY6431971.1 hypothetical protein [Rhodococcus sp. BP-322]